MKGLSKGGLEYVVLSFDKSFRVNYVAVRSSLVQGTDHVLTI